MTFTCTVCGSSEWMAVAPGTAPDAYCADHWRKSWVLPRDDNEELVEEIWIGQHHER